MPNKRYQDCPKKYFSSKIDDSNFQSSPVNESVKGLVKRLVRGQVRGKE